MLPMQQAAHPVSFTGVNSLIPDAVIPILKMRKLRPKNWDLDPSSLAPESSGTSVYTEMLPLYTYNVLLFK